MEPIFVIGVKKMLAG